MADEGPVTIINHFYNGMITTIARSFWMVIEPLTS